VWAYLCDFFFPIFFFFFANAWVFESRMLIDMYMYVLPHPTLHFSYCLHVYAIGVKGP